MALKVWQVCLPFTYKSMPYTFKSMTFMLAIYPLKVYDMHNSYGLSSIEEVALHLFNFNMTETFWMLQ